MKSSALLAKLILEVQSGIDTAEKKFQNLSSTELNWKESPLQWSILECLEHLNRYSRFYHPELKKAIRASVENKTDAEASSTWLGKKFIRMMHPDNTKKQKTLKHMNPVNSALTESVLEEFLNHQRVLLEIIESAKNTDLNKTKIPVEFMRFIKMNTGDALQFVIVHQQRHLLQAERILLKTHYKSEAVLKV